MRVWSNVVAFLFIFSIMMFCCFTFAHAEDTSGANWVGGAGMAHSHSYEAVPLKDPQVGLGADVKVYKFADEAKFLDSVNIETKYDFNNQSSSVYGVVKCDLTKVIPALDANNDKSKIKANQEKLAEMIKQEKQETEKEKK